MSEITVKLLSGDIFSLKVDEPYIFNILKELNKINPIQFPLWRTYLVTDKLDPENNDKIYYAYITNDLYLTLNHRNKVYTEYNDFIIDNKDNDFENIDNIKEFDEGMDGKYFISGQEYLREWQGFMFLRVKFEMSSTMMYRLFVISTINYEKGGPIISYKYDTDNKEDYERIATLLKNKQIKLNEEHVKNVMIKHYLNRYNKYKQTNEEYKDIHDLYELYKNPELYNLYKKSVYFRDDTIIVLNCNGEIVYTDHYHWYNYEQQPNWDYYDI